jgi:hypothetical protein
MSGGMWLNEAGGPPNGEVLPARRDPVTRRRRRQAWTFTTLVSLVLVVGVVALGQAMRWWTIGGPTAPSVRPQCPAETVLPADEVVLRVYNASERFGLARQVAKELQARGFTVTTITNDASGAPVKGTALVRYGQLGKLAAKSVSLQVVGPIALEDDGRASRTVDLVLGPGYKTMVPRPQASHAIAPRPTPVGCIRTTASPSPTPTPPGPAPSKPAASKPSASGAAPAPPTATRSVLTVAPTTPPSPGPSVLPTAP